ncbi:T9SS type A sorting domain-containing protein [Bacteroidota bacterium]
MKKLIIIITTLLLSISLYSQYQVIFSIDSAKFRFDDVYFVNDTVGFVVGIDARIQGTAPGLILRTKDGGISWDTTIFNATTKPTNLHTVHFPTQDTGYVAGFGTTIAKTTNGGNTWNILDSTGLPWGADFKTIYFLNAYEGFVSLGNSGSLLAKTNDGGLSWNIYGGINIIGGRELDFVGDSIGVLCSGNGYFITKNSGISWDTITTGISFSSHSISFSSTNIGFIAGLGSYGTPNFNYGVIGRTIDGGQTWSSKEFQSIRMLNTIFAVDSNIVYAGGDPQGIGNVRGFMKSPDGGLNWGFQECSNCDPTLRPIISSMYFVDAKIGYAVDPWGFIYKTTNGGGTIYELGMEDISTSLTVQDIYLYPNPAQNYINILLNKPSSRDIEIQIYDIVGKLINTYNHENLQSFNKIDISKLKAGIYFVKVGFGNGEFVLEKFVKM